MIPIADVEDPRISAYRAIRERDLVTRHEGRPGLFVAEGEVVLRVLLSPRARLRPVSILVSESRLASLRDVLPVGEAAPPVYVASPALLSEIAGFPMHRGILALGARLEGIETGSLLPAGPSLVLVLAGLANHDNVGGAFRNAAAFGADAVLLDSESCDPLYRKSIRVSVGAALTVPFARGGTAEELIGLLVGAGYTPFALSPAGREEIGEVAWPERTALIVGAEGPGLPAALIARLRSVRIAMAAGFDSLNVAAAAAIALHAASVSRRSTQRH